MPSSFLLHNNRTVLLVTQVGIRHSSLNSHDWLKRRLKDPYVDKARQENYRCRSAFKLLEIDDRFKIIQPGQIAIDIGAAPGSWTQVLVSRTNATGKDSKQPKGMVLSLDLKHIYDVPGAIVLGGLDFTLDSSQEKIIKALDQKCLNFVYSDMAPNATGVKALDQEKIFNLGAAVLKFSVKNLKVKGGCLIKFWDGGMVKTVYDEMNRFFNNVRYVRPKATQEESSELYLLARDFKGLKKEELS